MALNIDPALFRYTAKSRQAGLSNGYYTAFPRQSLGNGKFKSEHIQMTEETLDRGYLFFPGLRVAVAFAVKDANGADAPQWWTVNPAYLTIPVVKLIAPSVEKGMNELIYPDASTASPWSVVVSPKYVQSFVAAVQGLVNTNQLPVNIGQLLVGNLQSKVEYFKQYDASHVKDEAKKAAKAMSLAEALSILEKVRGYTRGRKLYVTVEGEPKKESAKTATKGAAKVPYSPAVVAQVTKEGKWLDISKAVVSKSGNIKDVRKLDEKLHGPHVFVYSAAAGKPQYNILYIAPKDDDPKRQQKAQEIAASIQLFLTRLNVKAGEDFNWELSRYDVIGGIPQVGTARQQGQPLLLAGVIPTANAPAPAAPVQFQPIAMPSQLPAVAPIQQQPVQLTLGTPSQISVMPGMPLAQPGQIISNNMMPAPPAVGTSPIRVGGSPPLINSAADNF